MSNARLPTTGPASTTDRGSFPSLRAFWLYVNQDQRLGTAILTLVLGGGFCLMPLLVFAPLLPFWTEGIQVRGTVLARDPVAFRWHQPAVLAAGLLAHGGGWRGPTHFIDYEFLDPAGVRQSGRSGVTVADWSRLKPGDEVDVVYLKSDPTQSRLWLGLDNGQWALIAFATIGLLIISYSVRTFVSSVLSVRREVALLRDGVLTPGQVLELANEEYDSRSMKSTIRYSYTAPTTFAGPLEERVGTYISIGKPWFTGNAGDAIPVVYSSDEPERSTIDRFALRTSQ